MPTGFWKIHSYTVLLHQSGPNPGYGQRKLTLKSAPPLYLAEISFRDVVSSVGSVYVFDSPDPIMEHVESSWPTHRFQETYEVLRSEKPVFLAYSWGQPDDKPDAPYGFLFQIGLTSADRPWWEHP